MLGRDGLSMTKEGASYQSELKLWIYASVCLPVGYGGLSAIRQSEINSGEIV